MTIFDQAVHLLTKQESFAYATIITKSGSAPRSAGAKMLITAEAIYGTIGGGGMEGQVIVTARQSVLVDHQPLIRYYNLSGADAAISDFICGGEQEVLIDYIDAADAMNLTIFTAAAEAALSGERAWLVTALDHSGQAQYARQFCLTKGKGAVIGQFHDDVHFTGAMAQSPFNAPLHSEQGADWRLIVDAIHTGGVAYIFGAGHVSKEIAKITTMVEFHTVVIDDRAEFANSERFPDCDVRVIDSFEKLPQLPIDQDSYILIVTRGHLYDRTVLAWALGTNAAYIGMIGSLSKRNKIYDALREEGVSDQRLAEVYSPIGLKIGSETPAEIAVSIVGELIQVRAKHRK